MTRSRHLVGFSGHMTDTPDRSSPRFPESRVPEVRLQIRTALEQQPGPLHGVCSAARGGDLLFLESLLALGGTATVLLPFPPADFKKMSVGGEWDGVFDQILASPQVDVPRPLHEALPADTAAQNQAFEACNTWIVDALSALASQYDDTTPLFISVFHGAGGQSPGGTWDAIARSRAKGHKVLIIDPLADSSHGPPGGPGAAQQS